MNLHELFDKCLNKNLIDLTISGRKDKSQDEVSKVKIRPVIIKNNLLFQVSEYKGTKVYHDNYSEADVRNYIEKMMTDNFKQAQFKMTDADAQVLSGKNSNMTIKYKKSCEVRCQKELSHNRNKKYILEEGKKVDFLVDLGVMTKEGKIVNQRYDKYRQINRFLEFIEDILPELDSTREQTIIDFGCGKSYLTFILYHYFTNIRKIPVHMTGLDLKEDVIEKCNLAAKKYGYENLHFELGDICGYQSNEQVDMVITLHACDTATDHALYHAVRWNTEMIFSVPCCQHELNSQIQSEDYSILTRYGLIKERTAALMTDAIRANLLEACGYKTDILEFVDFAHTPKNLLIRAKKKPVSKDQKEKRIREVERLMQEYHLQPTFYQLLKEASYI